MIPESPPLTASEPTPTADAIAWLVDKLTEDAAKAREDARMVAVRAPSRPDASALAEERESALRWLSAHLPEMIRDGERLDALERQANEEPLLLHAGRPGVTLSRTHGSYLGLGLEGTNRTLRKAIDQAFPGSRPLGETK